MAEPSHSIDLRIAEKLKDREYRKQFFWAEASADIAAQLIELRKRRNMSQKDVAEAIGTQQPAISRAERADYQNWNLQTLRAIADALDARLQVVMTPAEDVLAEYDATAEGVQHAQGDAGFFAGGYAQLRVLLDNMPTPAAPAIFYFDPQASGTRDEMWTRRQAQIVGAQTQHGAIGSAGGAVVGTSVPAGPISDRQSVHWLFLGSGTKPRGSTLQISDQNVPEGIAL